MKPAYFNWSSGKDSAYALYNVQQEDYYDIKELLISVNSSLDRVTMHGLRRSVLLRQLESLNIPFSFLELPENPTMEAYGDLMRSQIAKYKDQGLLNAGFGDILLEDLKKYREQQLSSEGVEAFFPLWNMNTTQLISNFIQEGFKTIVVAVNGDKLDKSFAGRIIDESFINDLPDEVDPCGENGEFHTFCFDGPVFNKPVSFQLGEIVTKSYPSPVEEAKSVVYYFADIL